MGKQKKWALMNYEVRVDPRVYQMFLRIPKRVQKTARKNYKLWKQNPFHPSLEFKKLKTNQPIYSVRAGIGWRAVGVMKDSNTIVWFWIGSHSNYDKLLKNL